MTQEPREVSTDEPQIGIEETDERIEPVDEDQITESHETEELVSDAEVPESVDEDAEAEGGGVDEADEVDLNAAAQESDEPVEEDGVAAEAIKEEFEEDPPRSQDDEELEEELAEEADADNGEAENTAEQEMAEAEGEEASEEQDQADDTEEEQTQTEDTKGDTPTVESVIEAILFATDEPLTENRLANIVETTNKQVRQCIEALNEKYEQHHNAFRIEQIAGGYQMLTLSTYNTWLRKMLRVRSDNKLSPAAMETLAIIAYKQPVIRVDIEAIRGVAVGEVIRSLMYKGLVKIVGRAEILGRPMLYGTTKKFLETFGLNSLKDLPKVEELKKPD